MHFLDTSALVKLVFEEMESTALVAFLGADPFAVSALSRTELRRVALRVSAGDVPRCDALLNSCFQVALTPEVLDSAGLLEPVTLRSLNAVQLACARLIEAELDEFVAYDQRLIEAAAAAGFSVSRPGVS
jgi:predicted nucleic acid-binding protein